MNMLIFLSVIVLFVITMVLVYKFKTVECPRCSGRTWISEQSWLAKSASVQSINCRCGCKAIRYVRHYVSGGKVEFCWTVETGPRPKGHLA